MILSAVLILAVVILAAVLIALAAPASAPGKWLAQGFRDVFSFVYTELGTVLRIFKDPSGKFSGKRAIAIGLAAAPWVFIGVPKDLYQLIVIIASLLVSAGLYVLAELTKT
jgi:hypothetical protein